MMSFDISQHFDQYFSLKIANTEELLKEVYRIRYEVYCEELQYESTENFPDGLEKDAYDSHSIHCLLLHKATGTYAGCVRIILPQKGTIKPIFPWQKFEPSLIYDYPEHKLKNLCEISRLAVRSQFRKRKGDDELPLAGISAEGNGGKRRFPLIAMSLYWSAFCLALNFNLDIFAIMEPRLARHLRRFGLSYCMFSELFEHHGTRGIFFTKPPELLDSLELENYKFFYFLNNIIATSLCESKHISYPFFVHQPDYSTHTADIK